MRLFRFEPFILLPEVLKWSALATLVGAGVGSAVALFLSVLSVLTDWREGHLWIIAFLPVAGFVMGLIYSRFGKSVEGGNDLIIDEIHNPRAVIPLRMSVLILLATWTTHLFGGSAGREGTAVQMGGSLADQLTRAFKLKPEDRRIVLMMGMSAGFSAVFGTPLAGTVFGLEVLAIGKLRYEALFPCLVASVVGDLGTQAWGIVHESYLIGAFPELLRLSFHPSWILYSVVAGAIFGLTGLAFAASVHGLSTRLKTWILFAPLRPVLGGFLVAFGVWALGSTRYIGLGTPAITQAFQGPVPSWDFALKFVFTVLTLGSGFKGGEVTPLFFIGATLGNTLGHVFPLPSALLCGMGFVAVFAGAANTPIACTLMAVELFGSQVGIYAGLACVGSYLFSGHAGIYHSQRKGDGKLVIQ